MSLLKRYTGTAWESIDIQSIVIDGQTINAGVNNYELVIYDSGDSEWIKCDGWKAPVGMKIGSGQICTKGYVSGLTGLTAGVFYYMDSSGDLSTTLSSIKVGHAISTTELIIDIDADGSVSVTRGLFGGGVDSGSTGINNIDYITINTADDATDFGDLTIARYGVSACSSSTRGLFAGGYVTYYTNVIDYVAIATTGTASDFGDLTGGRVYVGGCSNSTRGLFAGGAVSGGRVYSIDYITIATLASTDDFGDLYIQTRDNVCACSSPTRGLFAGDGYVGIDYVTISTLGTASDFGDLINATYYPASCSSSTRGLFAGGYSSTMVRYYINYVTIATLGNAEDFGDLSMPRYGLAATSSKVRGVFAGGTISTYTDIIDYVTIATLGNATDFGDLTVARRYLAGCSNGHGGLA